MSQALPTGGFEWVSHLNQEEVQTLEAYASEGYILEVDLEYPKELHDAHNDYPLAPQRLEAKKAWVSAEEPLKNDVWSRIRRGGEAGTKPP